MQDLNRSLISSQDIAREPDIPAKKRIPLWIMIALGIFVLGCAAIFL